MIKVLEKALDIIEMLAESPAAPKPLKEIASRLNMHPATCANILKTLALRRFVEQPAPRCGYALGPALFYAAGNPAAYGGALLEQAMPAMRRLAENTDESVVLVVLRNANRTMLGMLEGTRPVRVNARATDSAQIYETATGRLLMAFSPLETELALKRFGPPPQAVWPEAASSPQRLAAALAAIRRQGRAEVRRHDTVSLAFPIMGPAGKVEAALGLFLPEYRFKGRHRASVLNELRRAAAAITKRRKENGFATSGAKK